MARCGRRLATRAGVAISLAAIGLFAFVTVTEAAANPIQISVQTGYHNNFKLGQWMPVAVDITNNGPALDGRLEIQVDSALGAKGGGPGGTAIYEVPISLAGGATKHFRTFVTEDFSVPIAVRLIRDNKTIASRQVTPANLTSLLVGVLSDRASALDELAAARPGGFTPGIAHLAAADLPDSGLVLRAFDMIAIDDFATDTLTGAQRTALTDYVTAGGSLLLGTGGSWRKTLAGLQSGIVPMDVTGSTILAAPASLAGVRGLEVATGTPNGIAWMSEAKQPLLIEKQLGEGIVTLATFDWNQGAIAAWSGESTLLRQVFVRSTFGFGAAQTIFGVGGNGAISASQRGTNLTQALSNLPSLNLPAWWLIGSLILVYVLLVGPVNYVVLRAMNRRALAWITVPAIAIVAAGGAYGTGLITKGTSVQANELSIIHVESGWDRAYQEAYTGILAPTRGDYQVGVAGGRTMISPLYSYGNPFIDPNQGLLRIDTANDAITMPGMSAFTLRGFASESVALAPRVEATATVAGGKLVGTVRNASTTLFSDGVLLAGNSFQKFGALAPGASATFSLQPSFANPANGPPAYQAIYANSYSCCPPQPQSSSDAEREAEIKFYVLNMLPVNGFKGIVLSSAPTVLLWTKQSFQDITVNGNHPHSYVESAVVLTLPVGQISAGTLGAGVVAGRVVDVEADLQTQGGPPGLAVTQGGGSVTYDFAPQLATGSRLSEVSISASNPYGIKGVPNSGSGIVAVKGQAWDWTKSQWVDVSYVDPGETVIPDSAVNRATGEVKLKVSAGEAFSSGWLSLTGTVK